MVFCKSPDDGVDHLIPLKCHQEAQNNGGICINQQGKKSGFQRKLAAGHVDPKEKK
jgi:hypothetical protein